MRDKLLMFSIKMKNRLMDEAGQDLIEYALVVALIALGATVGMSKLATGINAAFGTITNTLAGYTGGTT